MNEKPTNDGVLYIQGVPRNLKNHFKAYCARRGLTLKEMTIRMWRKCLEEETKQASHK